MGVSSSKLEEDKALQLCRERKKFVRQALDGRCSLAATHVMYVQSLRNTGTALRKFVEPEGPIESSLYTSTNATPEPLSLTGKSPSQFSFSPNFSQHVETTGIHSPSPSPPTSSRFQANHMKFRGFSYKKVEEKPPSPAIEAVISSNTPQNTTPRSTEPAESSQFEDSPLPPETQPWDYFADHPIDHQFSFQEGRGMNQQYESADDLRRLREEEGIPELEDEEEKASFHEKEQQSQDLEDDFDEPAPQTLVRPFENRNRLHDHNAPSASPTMPSAESVASESELVNGGRSNSPSLSPVRATSSIAAHPTDQKEAPVKEDCIENKVASKDFFSSMKDIELLFIKASDSGKEVPRMLEANKLHFRPIFEEKDSDSMASTILKACFSCGEDPPQVQEEPVQTDVKYLTWHRTASSRSSSSRNPLGANSKDDVEDLTGDIFDSIHMISSSHASTLDRLYAWERKLYDEVKASEMIRREYDSKCRILRQLESKGVSSHKIDKTRAVVKDLHSRIKVAIHRIDSISKRIEELRDKELQPQLEDLIEGLSRMWEVMFECHKLQFQVISVAYNNAHSKISIKSDSHRQITIHLENELSSLSSSFTKWISAQKFYLQAINNWLVKCVSLPQKSSRRKRRAPPPPPLRNFGPPIYATCSVWLDLLDWLPSKELTDSIKSLASETSHFLPRQEKNQGKSGSETAVNLLADDASEDWISGFDRFRSSLVGFLGQLNNFSENSVHMYADLKKAIQDAKIKYDELVNREAESSNDQLKSQA